MGYRMPALPSPHFKQGIPQRIPSMNEALAEKDPLTTHLYRGRTRTQQPESLAKRLDIPLEKAQNLIIEAGSVLEKLRRRSECRKFMRDHLIPRKGRSYAKILTALKNAGITELSGLAHADIRAAEVSRYWGGGSSTGPLGSKTVYYGPGSQRDCIPQSA